MSISVNMNAVRPNTLDTLQNVKDTLQGQLGQFEQVLGQTTQTGGSEMMYYLKLQEQMMAEQRAYMTISNIMKARHDAATNAIRNVK